jgi:nucleotide-binding universal stress UspA family protein
MKDHSYRRILFAVDAEGHARAAAPAVARLAAAAQADVVVLHVQEVDFIPRFGRWETESEEESLQLAEAIAAEMKAAGVEATAEVRVASRQRIADEIAAAALANGADVVALGSRGLSDVGALVLGSVSHRVLKSVDCPVLICRGGSHTAKGPIRRILVGIEAEGEMEQALATAAEVARLTDAEVLVLHVDFVFSGEAAAYSESDDEGKALVDKALAKLAARGLKAMGWSIGGGDDVADDIAKSAAAWNADLIVVGSRRHSDLAAIFAGSVDHDLIRRADQPVLIAERQAVR